MGVSSSLSSVHINAIEGSFNETVDLDESKENCYNIYTIKKLMIIKY